jgi:hypothetical protein
MAQNIEFTLQRAVATRAAQTSLSPGWVWEEKTLVQWDTSITGLETQMETETDAEAEMIAKRGETDAAIDALHSLTARSLRMAKNRYRNDPAKLAVFQNLRGDSGSRAGKIQDALEWESGWEKTDALWVPLPGITLANFKTSRLAAITLLEAFAGKKAAWESADAVLDAQGRALSADCVAWYEAATTVFPEGTPEGDMIRSTVPTSYTPPSSPPTALLIASATPQPGGSIQVTYVPGGGQDANSLRLRWQVVGVDAGFDHDVAVNLAGQTLTGFTAGQTVKLSVRAGNTAGNTDGPEVTVITL